MRIRILKWIGQVDNDSGRCVVSMERSVHAVGCITHGMNNAYTDLQVNRSDRKRGGDESGRTLFFDRKTRCS